MILLIDGSDRKRKPTDDGERHRRGEGMFLWDERGAAETGDGIEGVGEDGSISVMQRMKVFWKVFIQQEWIGHHSVLLSFLVQRLPILRLFVRLSISYLNRFVLGYLQQPAEVTSPPSLILPPRLSGLTSRRPTTLTVP